MGKITALVAPPSVFKGIIISTKSEHNNVGRVDPIRIKADKRSLIGFSVIFLSIFLGFAYLNAVKGGAIVPLYISFIFYAAFICFLNVFEIRIQDEQLIYKSPFSGEKKIFFHEIRYVNVRVGFGSNLSDQLHGALKLVISPSDKCDKDTITINMKIFRKSDISMILNAIRKSSHDVDYDDMAAALERSGYDVLYKPMVDKIIESTPSIIMFIVLAVLILSLARELINK